MLSSGVALPLAASTAACFVFWGRPNSFYGSMFFYGDHTLPTHTCSFYITALPFVW
jgi:hypothetical protein